MSAFEDWSSALGSTFAQIAERVVQFVPSIVGAFVLLLAGWLVARVLRAVTIRTTLAADRVISRFATPPGVERVHMPLSSARIFGNVVFWVVVLFFLTAASQLLGLSAFTTWLSELVAYLPTLLAGTLIIAAGVVLSRLASGVVAAAAVRATQAQRELLGRAVQALILVTAILVGAEQIGIKVTFLVILAAAAAGTVVASVALALSLGARDYVANLIGGHHFRQLFQIGQTIRVAGFEGRILDLTPVSVILETEEGRVTLPAKLFSDEPVVLVMGSARDGQA